MSERSGAGFRLPQGGLRAGSVLLGCVVEAELGRGGMGAVYRARDAERGTPVALKVMLDPRRGSAIERFRREVQALRELDHPGVVRLLRAELVGERPCLVMELVEGRGLDAVYADPAVGLDAKLMLLEQVCRAVQHAHDRGIVHRDLKPANVLVAPDGTAKVTDFGLVRDLDRQTRLTKTGVMVGTPSYMSPEQVAAAKEVREATDIYSLGVMLFEAMTGELPFDGDSALQLVAQIVNEPPPRPSSRNAALGPAHDAVCLRALSKAAKDRQPSAQALAADLARLRARGGGARWVRPLIRGLLIGGALGVLATLGLFVWSAPARLGPEELNREASKLYTEAGALLETPGPFRERAAAVGELASRLEALCARGPADGQPKVERAAQRLAALEGLVALSAGDLESAGRASAALPDDARDPVARALRGGVAAVASGGDRSLAVRDLGRALERGLAGTELRAWRAQARSALGFDRLGAEETLRDLEQVAAARPLTAAEGDVRVQALVAVDRLAEAERALSALSAPSARARWAVALRHSLDAYSEEPGKALERLRSLPPEEPPNPARKELATRVYELVEATLAARQRSPLDKEEKELALTQLQLGLALWPGEEPGWKTIAALLVFSTGEYGSAKQDSVGDPPLAVRLGDLFPRNLRLQREVAGLLEFSSDQRDKRMLLRSVRRVIRLTDEEAERRAWRLKLCVAIGFLNNRFEKSWNEKECRELLRVAPKVLPSLEAQERANVIGARAVAQRRLGEFQRAWSDLDEAQRLFPKAPEFAYTRLQVAKALGRKEAALRSAIAYVDAQESASDRGTEALIEIWEQARGSDPNRVLRPRLEQFLRHRPEMAGWWVRLAQVQLNEDDLPAARQSLKTAVSWIETPRGRYEAHGAWAGQFRELEKALREQGAGAAPAVARLVEALESARHQRAKPGEGHPFTP